MAIEHEDFIYTQTWTCPKVEEIRLVCETNCCLPAEF
jgi:hypothetical protein